MRAADHPVALEEVMAYLDGELAPDRSAAVHTHVAMCTACQDVASRFRTLSAELTAWQLPEPPALAPPPAPATEPASRSSRWWLPQVWRLAGTVALTVLTSLVTVVIVFWVASADLRRARVPMTREQADAAELQQARAALGESSAPQAAEALGPRQIVRTAMLSLVVTDFAAVRPALDRALRTVGGFLGQIHVTNSEEGPTMTAILRVPASRLEEALGALRGLGHVARESQSGDDVSDEVTDLEARLANARNTETRLLEVLRTGTGSVSEVLEVEREISRVRGEIEKMRARRQELERRIVYATLTVHVSMQRQAVLRTGEEPVRVRLRNASVDGVRLAYDSAVATAAFLFQVLPLVLVWTAVLWFPVRALLRMRRARRN